MPKSPQLAGLNVEPPEDTPKDMASLPFKMGYPFQIFCQLIMFGWDDQDGQSDFFGDGECLTVVSAVYEIKWRGKKR